MTIKFIIKRSFLQKFFLRKYVTKNLQKALKQADFKLLRLKHLKSPIPTAWWLNNLFWSAIWHWLEVFISILAYLNTSLYSLEAEKYLADIGNRTPDLSIRMLQETAVSLFASQSTLPEIQYIFELGNWVKVLNIRLNLRDLVVRMNLGILGRDWWEKWCLYNCARGYCVPHFVPQARNPPNSSF